MFLGDFENLIKKCRKLNKRYRKIGLSKYNFIAIFILINLTIKQDLIKAFEDVLNYVTRSHDSTKKTCTETAALDSFKNIDILSPTCINK